MHVILIFSLALGNLLCILGAWIWDQQRFGIDELVIGITTAAGRAQAGPTYVPYVPKFKHSKKQFRGMSVILVVPLILGDDLVF